MAIDTTCIRLSLLGLMLVSCAEDLGNLGGGIPPGEGGDPDSEITPYPISTDYIRFGFSRNYVPDVGTQNNGATVGEITSSGQICTQINEIKNGHDTDTPSTLTGQVKVSGFASGSDIDFKILDQTGQNRASPSYQDVDDTHGPLWLMDLLFPTRNHAYTAPTQVTFATQNHIAPPNQSLTNLLFFDPRVSQNKNWDGFINSSGADNQTSFVDKVYQYFADTYGFDAFIDPTRITKDAKDIISSCADHTDFSSCSSQGCSWSGSECEQGNYQLQVTWRTTLSTGPQELLGDIIHSVTTEYSAQGQLEFLNEYVIKDTTSSSSLQHLNACPSTGPCLSSAISLKSGTWENAPCTF
jgi:hypothetical protein